MSLDITAALKRGTSLLVSRTGLLLLVVYGLASLAYVPTSNGLLKAFLERQNAPVRDAELLTYDAPLWVYSVAFLTLLVVLTYVGILAFRVFAAGERDAIPAGFYTRNIVWVFVNYLLGGLAFSVVVFLGTLLLVVPGVFAYVSLVFVVLFVAVEDESFLAGFRHSWRLTSGERLRVFALLAVLFVGMVIVGVAVSFGLSILTVAGLVSRPAGSLVTTLAYMPITLYFVAVLAAAFNQLRGGDDDAEGQAGDDSEWEFGVDDSAVGPN